MLVRRCASNSFRCLPCASRRHITLPRLLHDGSSLLTSKRWCFSHLPGSANNPPPATSSPATTLEEGSSKTTPAVRGDELVKKLRSLSHEDQELIMNALRNTATSSSEAVERPNLEDQSATKPMMGGHGIGIKDGDMMAAFTCGRCEHRMVKRFSKHAYTKGIVIVQCEACQVKHLLADNLGWIEDEARNIEDILREKGERFTRVGDGDYQAE